jgi:hypothetical protein
MLVRLAGFEPATRCLEGSCSIRLSYRRSPLTLCRIKVTHGTQARGVGAGQVGRAASDGQGWERDASGGWGWGVGARERSGQAHLGWSGRRHA